MENRPQEITDILTSLKYWNKHQMIVFLEEFIQENCNKVTFVLNNVQIMDNLKSYTDSELRSQIIHLLQSIKDLKEVKLPHKLVNH